MEFEEFLNDFKKTNGEIHNVNSKNEFFFTESEMMCCWIRAQEQAKPYIKELCNERNSYKSMYEDLLNYLNNNVVKNTETFLKGLER